MTGDVDTGFQFIVVRRFYCDILKALVFFYSNPFSAVISHVIEPVLPRAVWETIGVKQDNEPTQAD